MVWYSHLFKNFPQFAVIHASKGFSRVNEAEVDVFFWKFYIPKFCNVMFFTFIELKMFSNFPCDFLFNSWIIFKCAPEFPRNQLGATAINKMCDGSPSRYPTG